MKYDIYSKLRVVLHWGRFTFYISGAIIKLYEVRRLEKLGAFFKRIKETDKNSMVYESLYIKNPFERQYQFHTEADIKGIKKDLNYVPKFSLEEGIKDYIPEIKRIFESEVNA